MSPSAVVKSVHIVKNAGRLCVHYVFGVFFGWVLFKFVARLAHKGGLENGAKLILFNFV